MAVKFANNVSTSLSAAINATQTTISVADASRLPTLSSGDYIYLTIDTDTASPTIEVVKVTAISSNDLTVVRGQDGTTAASFSNGTKVELRVTAAALDDIAAAGLPADGDGSDLQNVRAETVEVTIKNTSGSSIAKGTPVHQTGTSGAATFEVTPALAGTASTMPAHFIAAETLADEEEGRGILMGRISGVDTSSFSEGDTIYVGASGGFVNTPPTGEGNLIQNLGTVTRVDATNGGGEVYGAGRSNATPNLNDGNIFIGNASNQASTASLSTSVSGLSHYNDTNWNTAYTYSQVGHVPLAGGTMTGALTTTGLSFSDASGTITFGSGSSYGSWGAPKIFRTSSITLGLSDYNGVELGGWNGTAYGPRLVVNGNGNVDIKDGDLRIGTTSVLTSARALQNITGISSNGPTDLQIGTNGGSDNVIVRQTGQSFTPNATNLTGLGVRNTGTSGSYSVFETQTGAGTAFQVRNNGDVRVLRDLMVNGTTRIAQNGDATLGTISSGAITATGTSTFATAISAGTTTNTDTLHLYKYQADHGIRIQGSSSNWYFYNKYSDSGNLHITNNGSADIEIDGSANISGLGTISSGAITSSGSLTVSDFLKASGNNLKFSAGGNHIMNIDLNGKIYPQTDNHTDLGFSTSAARFRNLYLSGTVHANSYTGSLASAVTATTQSASDNSTKVATTAYVDSAVSGLVDSAPSTLDTLNELAAALGDDANFSTTVTNSIATKLPLAGGTMTGALNMGANAITSTGTISSGSITSTGAVYGTEFDLPSGGMLDWANGDARIVEGLVNNYSLSFQTYDGSNATTALRLDGDNTATFAGTISSGKITASGSGTASSPVVAITSSNSSAFIHASNAFAANMTAGQFHGHFFGSAGSTKNAGAIGYYWAASGSDSNFVSIGHWGADHLLRLYGNGNLSIHNGGLQMGGTTVIDSSRNLTNLGNITATGLTTLGRTASDRGAISDTNTALIATSRGVTHTDSQTNVLRLQRDGTSGVVYAGLADIDLERWENSGVFSRTAMHFKLGHGNLSPVSDANIPTVMTLRSSGMVGIGSTAPSKPLHVKTSLNEGIFLEGTSNGVWMDVQSNGSELWSMGADSNGWAIYNRTDSAYRLRVENGGTLEVLGNAKADIFYDRNDTSRYLNPAGNSILSSASLGTTSAPSGSYALRVGSIQSNNASIDYLSQVHFNDNLRFYDEGNNNYLNFKWGNAGSGGMKFRDGDGNIEGYIYGDTGGFGILSSDGSWAVSSYNARTYIYHELQTPIVYDMDNTAYYSDPASTSEFNRINQQHVSINAGDGQGIGFWNGAGGGSYSIWMSASSNSTYGGRVTGDSNSDYNMYFRMEGGTNRGFVFRSGNTNHSGIDASGNARFSGEVVAGTNGSQATVKARYDTSDNYHGALGWNHIQLGNNGSNQIWAGRTNTGGYLDIYTNVTGTATGGTHAARFDTGGNVYSYGSSRSPIFYDTNDTTYFLNPADTVVSGKIAGYLADKNDNKAQHWKHSQSDFVNGTLITTDINSSVQNGASFIMEVTGKSYDTTHPPFSFMVQGYLYNNTIISYSGVNNGDLRLTYVKVFNNNGTLGFWFPRIAYWHSFNVYVREASGTGDGRNCCTGISNSAEPTASNITKKVQIDLKQSVLYSHNVNAADLYAARYYDKDDTSYYADPASTSRFNAASFIGDVDFNGGSGALDITHSEIRSAATSDWQGNPGANGKIQYHSNRWYIVGDNASNRIVQFRRDGSDKSWIDNDGRLLDQPDARAPIFYDSANTGYFVDPNNGGFVLAGGSSNRVTFSTNDSGYKVSNAEGQGAFDLRLGAAWGRVGIYNSGVLNVMSDSTSGIEFIIDNASYGTLNTDYLSHISDIRAPLFYDSNDTGYYLDPASTTAGVIKNLVIKPQSQSWSEGIRIDVPSQTTWAGIRWAYAGTATNTNNWALGTTAQANYNITFYTGDGNHVWELDKSGNNYIVGSSRAPIFYDYNNTAYFVDPASSGISANFNGRIQVGTFNQSQNNVGEAWIGRAADRLQGTLTVQLGSGSGRSFEVVDSGWTTIEFSADDSGVAQAAGSMRAPIFYDKNNTAYYVDPDSASNDANIFRGGARFGPNTSWSEYLAIGTNGNISNRATVATTNGNLHLDSKSSGHGLYLNHYSNGPAYYKNVLYDGNNTAYYTQNGSTSLFNFIRVNSLTVGSTSAMSSAGNIAVHSSGNPYISFHSAGGTARTAYIQHLTDADRLYFGEVGYTESTGSFRAPLFYDVNNTGYYSDNASTSRFNVIHSNDYKTEAGDGRGIGFWNGVGGSAYSIYMSSAGNSTYGGRTNGETTSDYNMYFRMSTGTNRGFVFRNDTTNVAGIDGGGNGYFNSARATIFYDVNNTGYYLDPSAANRLDNLICDRYRASGSSSNMDFEDSNGGVDMRKTPGGDLIVVGNVTAYGSTSDIRLKENIETIPDALEKVKKLDGVTFDYKKDGTRSTGLIAQQLQEVLPEVVYEATDIGEEEPHLAVRYGNVVGLLVEAMKEQSAQIDALRAEIESLKGKSQ